MNLREINKLKKETEDKMNKAFDILYYTIARDNKNVRVDIKSDVIEQMQIDGNYTYITNIKLDIVL